jgi:iron complex outermembrane receptor protein
MPEKYVRKLNRNAKATRLRPVATAVGGILVAIVGTAAIGLHMPEAYAADPVTSPAQKSYQVSAGPLGPALMDFAAQAGINLSMDLSKLKDKRTPACLVSTPSIAVLHICWKARD